jgi:hypothetical protein
MSSLDVLKIKNGPGVDLALLRLLCFFSGGIAIESCHLDGFFFE